VDKHALREIDGPEFVAQLRVSRNEEKHAIQGDCLRGNLKKNSLRQNYWKQKGGG